MTTSSSSSQPQHIDKIPRTSSHPRSTTTQQHESSTSSSSPSTTTTSLSEMSQLAEQMKSLQNSNTPLTTTEIDNIMTSITNVLPSDDDDDDHGIDLPALKKLLLESCHKSHKKWDETCQSATKLSNILLPNGNKGLSPTFRTMMERCLTEGNWEGATTAAASRSNAEKDLPWAVLVTGVNGIRKTTSVYQDWFPRLLSQALIEPSSKDDDDDDDDPTTTEEDRLPTGRNSFFRQLDHMIATLANVEFARLYELTSQSCDGDDLPIDDYSRLKDAIFVRYRTLAEMMGIVLIDRARREKLNVMVETSGRDVAMFHYVDRFFPSKEYRKLALHFTIDDLGYAERSVDLRMEKEIRDGMAVLTKASGDDENSNHVQDLIYVNAGGPYGSEVLKGVQRDSDKVWEEEVMTGIVGDDWYKATISIRGNKESHGVWTARAIMKGGGEGEVFEFERR